MRFAVVTRDGPPRLFYWREPPVCAFLADLLRLSREANDLGWINIQDGMKGGRAGASAPRWIGADGHICEALGFALLSVGNDLAEKAIRLVPGSSPTRTQ